MKKIFTYFCLVAFSFTTKIIAQPVVNTLDFNSLGTKMYLYPITGTLSHQNSGANLTWNEATVSYDPASVYMVDVPSSSQSQAVLDAFPTATYFTAIYTSNDVLIQVTVSEVKTDGQYTLGYVQGTNISVLPTPIYFLATPLTYQLNFGTRSYDAYGTLTTPFGTYNDVIRIASVGTTETNYVYYSFSPVISILLTYDVDNTTQAITGAYFIDMDDTGASIQENLSNNNFSVFPNPSTNGSFTINWVGSEADLTISAVSGQIVHSSKINQKTSFTSFENGVYFVTIKDGEKILTEKITIQ